MPRQPARIIHSPDGREIQIGVVVDNDGNATFSYKDNQGFDVTDFLIRGKTGVLFYADPENTEGQCKEFKIQARMPPGTSLRLGAGKHGKMTAGQFTSTPGTAPESAAAPGSPTQAINMVVERTPQPDELIIAPMNVLWTFADGPLKDQTYADDPDGYFEC